MSTSPERKAGPIRSVIFDLDGTLVDTAMDLASAMNYVLVANGVQAIPPEDVRHLVGFGAKAMLRQGFEQSTGIVPAEETLQSLVGNFVDYYHDHIAEHSRPFEGVEQVLAHLREKGVQLAVCTNKRENLARHLLEALGMSHWFQAIVGGDTAGVAKPEPAPVRLCQAQMAMNFVAAPSNAGESLNHPEHISVFVGDSDTDIRAAKASGLPCLVARFGYGPLDLREQADYVFDSYGDVSDILVAMLDQNTQP